MALLQIQKRVMALAGLVMASFLIFHVLMNLSLFSEQLAQTMFNWYQLPWIRWPIVLLFIIALSVHVRVAFLIRKQNFSARKVGYYKHDKLHIPPSLVSISIVLLLLFILFHLYQTFSLSGVDIRSQVISWFSSIWLSGIYLMGCLILSMHLLHSLMNVLQTMGISSQQFIVVTVLGVGIMFLSFASVPAYFLWSQI